MGDATVLPKRSTEEAAAQGDGVERSGLGGVRDRTRCRTARQ